MVKPLEPFTFTLSLVHTRSKVTQKRNKTEQKSILGVGLLGPRGPLGVCTAVSPSVRNKNFNQWKSTINHYIISQTYQIIYFLKAPDPHNPLTLRDDKDNDKYAHKYTN